MNIASFGDSLRTIRLKQGYSQEQAAELCDISEKTYGKLERGQANVSLNVLNKIEGGLGFSLVDMIQGTLPDGPGQWEYYAALEPCQVLDTDVKYTYAIMACKNTPIGRYITSIIHDVSTKPKFVADLVEQLNSYMLSPVHLLDVIYDRLP